MKPALLLVSAALLCVSLHLCAQDHPPVKFGKVLPEDFNVKSNFDSGANAIVIADIGNSYFEGNSKGWFSLVFKRSKRIKILTQNGFAAAKVEVLLYHDGTSEERVNDLKATTYSLESGKVVETKLESSAVFKDQLSKKYSVRKFTMPAVKEGSIIEYSYTVSSDFLFNLQPWAFQDEYPCLWSEYKVEIPEFFKYVTLNQGYQPLERKNDSYTSNFRVTIPGGAERNESVTLDGTVYTSKWVARDIPSLHEEGYTSALKNYVSRVEFQLSGYQFTGGFYHDMMGNWQLLGSKLMDGDYFGGTLARNNGWLDDDMKKLLAGASTKLEKAQKIFAYLRDNVTCTDHSQLYIETSLKDAYKKHSGGVADINLLLIAMLKHEGIDANPVILSTRENGFTHELYPLLDRFNYVICDAEIDGREYRLDASSPYNGFNYLPASCYNGHARVITKEAAMPIYLLPDSLKEARLTSVFIANGDKGAMEGSYISRLGNYESQSLRKKLKGNEKDYFKNIKSGNNFELKVSEAAIDSLKFPDMPAAVHYAFSFDGVGGDQMIYFNPMMGEGYHENPFRSADRKYPVEMPYASDETYVLNMEIPAGYVIEEVPKSTRVSLNETDGMFEYLVQKSATSIQLRSRIKINKATFSPEDYNALRDFFAFVVKKQNEQVVLKKQ